MKTIEIRNLSDDYTEIRSFIEELLDRNDVSGAPVSQTLIIFEALCHRILEQRTDEDSAVVVSAYERLGEVSIKFSFEGGIYDPEPADAASLTPEEIVLKTYDDKIDYSYHSGHNRIIFRVRRGRFRHMMASLAAAVIACIIYAGLHASNIHVGEYPVEKWAFAMVVYPLEELFANAVIMVGTPVTFLSLIKNLTDAFILSEEDSETRKAVKITAMSSVISVLLAISLWKLITLAVGTESITYPGAVGTGYMPNLGGFIVDMMPADLFTPFQSVYPFPIIILAALVTYASCSAGRYFDIISKAVDVGYVLFSRMLVMVTYTMPFFTGMTVLDLLLRDGFNAGASMIVLALIIALSPLVLALYYIVRLCAGGVPLRSFLRGLIPLLSENMKIASAIDAVPFNIRYCVKNYGMDRKRLESSLPVMAQINLDGNCFMITLIAMLFMTLCGRDSASELVLIPVLVLFLSLGAPNQPGSILIGVMLSLYHTESLLLAPIAIVCELLFGGLLNTINVTGDIVTVAIADQKAKAEQGKGRG